MQPRHISLLSGAILPLFAACDLQDPEPRQVDLASATGALKGNPAIEPTEGTSGGPGTQESAHPIVTSASPCECTKVNRAWHNVTVPSCDRADCADVKALDACKANPGCDYMRSCTCVCTDPAYQVFDHDSSDGVFLAGVPELWQFNYGCGLPANAVGCGPVAMASIFYWWAERGFPRLVEDHLTSAGLQDWMSLVRELRDDYADDGVCMPNLVTQDSRGEYLVTQDELEKELKDYVDDHGSFAYVRHYRVCADCDPTGDNDRSKADGLEIIQDELEAGRPLILGYASGRAEQSTFQVDGETVFTGDLSNGTGWINHYAVITGYRRTSDGRDIVYINKGSASTAVGMALEWNPAGKWTHLFTLSISSSAASSAQFCTLDDPLSATFSSFVNVEVSHSDRNTASATREFTVMAGASCGVARDGAYELFTPVRVDTIYCGTNGLADLQDYTDGVNAGPIGDGSQILDQQGPM